MTETEKETLNELSKLVNRSTNQLTMLYTLVGNDFYKLLTLENKIANNHLHYCPDDEKEVENVMNMDKYPDSEPFMNYKHWYLSEEEKLELFTHYKENCTDSYAKYVDERYFFNYLWHKYYKENQDKLSPNFSKYYKP